jgi:predicted nucleotide-binding protein
MTAEQLLLILREYAAELEGIVRIFNRKPNSYHIYESDEPRFRKLAGELIDLFNDALPGLRYAKQLVIDLQEGTAYGTPSFHCVSQFNTIVGNAIVRLERTPDLVERAGRKPASRADQVDPKKVFIIHGHDEAKRRELESLLSEEFGLTPVVLSAEPNAGANTIIEKFERYGSECSFAFALFTPDDQVTVAGETILQARPNVIWELGWFCGRLGRRNVMLLLKEGTNVFSDFSGILQHRFRSDVSERFVEIQRDLKAARIIS